VCVYSLSGTRVKIVRIVKVCQRNLLGNDENECEEDKRVRDGKRPALYTNRQGLTVRRGFLDGLCSDML
jgi:hypothetical protein